MKIRKYLGLGILAISIIVIVILTVSVVINKKHLEEERLREEHELAIRKEITIEQYKADVIETFNKRDINDVDIELHKLGENESDMNEYRVSVHTNKFADLLNEDKFIVIREFSELEFADECVKLNSDRPIYANNDRYTYHDFGEKGEDVYKNGESTYPVKTYKAFLNSNTSETNTTQSTATENYTTNTNKNTNTDTNTDKYTRTPTDDEKAFAWVAAKKAVKDVLKAPSTAKFPFSYGQEYIMKSRDNEFKIKSYVEAQNSFGAMVKTNFIVEIQKISEESYKVISVNLIE